MHWRSTDCPTTGNGLCCANRGGCGFRARCSFFRYSSITGHRQGALSPFASSPNRASSSAGRSWAFIPPGGTGANFDADGCCCLCAPILCGTSRGGLVRDARNSRRSSTKRAGMGRDLGSSESGGYRFGFALKNFHMTSAVLIGPAELLQSCFQPVRL